MTMHDTAAGRENATDETGDRLRRADSFFGLHFDFHAGDDCTEIGKNVTRAMLEALITQVRPDYVQCDCKGYMGYASYPTTVGVPVPGFVHDQLRLWREVTARHGVALYAHYAGGEDKATLKRHPDWAQVDAAGQPHAAKVSVFSPFLEAVMLPQLRELCDDYGLDGVWIDSDAWATAIGPDWHPTGVQRFRDETGRADAPRSAQDTGYHDYLDFCRRAWRERLAACVTAMRAHQPAFQVTSNWAYSSRMPEPPAIDVAFLSGDFPMRDSVRWARFEARCLASQGKPWDLMAWGFIGQWWKGEAICTKTAVQLQQEASMVLTVGGGFQPYFLQQRDGSIDDWTVPVMAEVAAFCRAREKICHRARPVPQVGLLYAGSSLYASVDTLFAPWTDALTPIQGVLDLLLDAQYSVDILMEHHLATRLADYPLLVVPEWAGLVPPVRDELLAYVREGGNLLLIGPAPATVFADELGVAWSDAPEARRIYLAHDGRLAGMTTVVRPVTLEAAARPFGVLYANNDFSLPVQPAAAIADYGRGRIAATTFTLGERYRRAATPVLRGFVAALVADLFPRPLVTVRGAASVDVAVNRIDGRLAINLVNTAGSHACSAVLTYDDIPPVGPLTLTIRTPQPPLRAHWYPDGGELPWRDVEDGIELTVERLAIHGVVVLEFSSADDRVDALRG